MVKINTVMIPILMFFGYRSCSAVKYCQIELKVDMQRRCSTSVSTSASSSFLNYRMLGVTGTSISSNGLIGLRQSSLSVGIVSPGSVP